MVNVGVFAVRGIDRSERLLKLRHNHPPGVLRSEAVDLDAVDSVFDEGRGGKADYPRSRSALAHADVGDIRAGLVVVDVEAGVDGWLGKNVEVLESLADFASSADAIHPGTECLARLSLLGEAAQNPRHCLGCGFRRQPKGLVAEMDGFLTDVAAEQHLIARRRLSVRSSLGAEETNVGDMVFGHRSSCSRRC